MTGSALEKGINPLLDPQPAFILRIKANAEHLAGWFGPAYRTANPDARQGQKSKRNFNRQTGCDFLPALQRHPATAQFKTAGRDMPVLSRDHGNLGDHWDAYVATKFMQHQHLRGPDQLQSRRALQRLIEDRVDSVLRELHRVFQRASESVDNHAAVGPRIPRRLKHGGSVGPDADHASLKFLGGKPLSVVGSHRHTVDAKLPEAFCEQAPGLFMQVNERCPS